MSEETPSVENELGTVVPVPETGPALEPVLPKTEEAKPMAAPSDEQKVLQVQRKAIIEWKKDPEGEVTVTEEEYRSLAALCGHLMDVLRAAPDRENDYLEIYLQVVLEDPAQSPRLYIAKGKLKEVIVQLRAKCLTANQAVMQLQMLLGHMSEISTLKGVIMTLVFSDAQAGGLGFLTESNQVTDEDIMVLGEAAASQADMFKEKMRESKNIVFPNDKGKVVLAGPGSLPPNLKFRR